MAKTSTALVVPDLDNLQISTGGNFHAEEILTALGNRARAEMEWIEQAEAMTPVRAIFLGIVLAQIRAGLPHGRWLPWMQKHFSKKKSTAYKFIALAKVCVIEGRIYAPEVIALPQLSLDFKPGNPRDDAAKALKKILRWVSKRSLNALYGEYVNAAPQLGGARSKGAKPAIDMAALHALKRDEVSELIERNRRLFLQENVLQFLKPDEVRGVVESIESLATELKHAVKPLLKKS